MQVILWRWRTHGACSRLFTEDVCTTLAPIFTTTPTKSLRMCPILRMRCWAYPYCFKNIRLKFELLQPIIHRLYKLTFELNYYLSWHLLQGLYQQEFYLTEDGEVQKFTEDDINNGFLPRNVPWCPTTVDQFRRPVRWEVCVGVVGKTN